MSDEKFLSHSHTAQNATNLGPNLTFVTLKKKRHENVSVHLGEVSDEIVIKDVRCHETSEGYEFSRANSMTSDTESWKKRESL